MWAAETNRAEVRSLKARIDSETKERADDANNKPVRLKLAEHLAERAAVPWDRYRSSRALVPRSAGGSSAPLGR